MRTFAMALALATLMIARPAVAQDLERTAIGLSMNEPGGYTFNGAFAFDDLGAVWSRGIRPSDPGWVAHGGAQTVSHGLAWTSAAPNHLAVWSINGNDIWLLYDYYGQWLWADMGPPPCGSPTGGLATAFSGTLGNGYLGGLVVCQDGEVAELWWNGSSWQWTNHAHPANVTIVSDIAAASSSFYTGAMARGSDGNLYELTGLGGGTTTWTNYGGPNGATLVGAPSLVSGGNPTSYVAAFLADTNGNLWELERLIIQPWNQVRWVYWMDGQDAHCPINIFGGQPSASDSAQDSGGASIIIGCQDTQLIGVDRVDIPNQTDYFMWTAAGAPPPVVAYTSPPSIVYFSWAFSYDSFYKGSDGNVYDSVWSPFNNDIPSTSSLGKP